MWEQESGQQGLSGFITHYVDDGSIYWDRALYFKK